MSEKNKYYEGKLVADDGLLLNEKSETIAFLDCDTLEQDKATAIELARRWNCHEELVQMLGEVAAQFSCFCKNSSCPVCRATKLVIENTKGQTA